jgi:hypothetical protein
MRIWPTARHRWLARRARRASNAFGLTWSAVGGLDADYASHHLVRVLDHWGVPAWGRERLARLVDDAQLELIRLRQDRGAGEH